MKILLTSTSFQDAAGRYQERLKETGYTIKILRGLVKVEVLMPIIGGFDGIICGDDKINKDVIIAGSKGRLKIISNYGVGIDKIDLEAAKNYNIPVMRCEEVNHMIVAEHVMAL